LEGALEENKGGAFTFTWIDAWNQEKFTKELGIDFHSTTSNQYTHTAVNNFFLFD
jgi:hypothetical protein